MDLLQAFVVVLACSVAAAVTWFGCRWWYGRKLQAAAQRLHKSDQSRLFSQQQTLQARKQIEALKKELEDHRRALQDTEVSRRRTRELEQALAAAEIAAERAAERSSTMMPLAPSPAPHHGFADTQVMP
jgi:hypothetical protein